MNQLEQLTSGIIRDYIFEINMAEDKINNKRVVVSYISEIMMIRAKLDQDVLEDLRKYWKSKGIDYRCILELKDAVEVSLKEEEEVGQTVYIKNELCKKVQQSLRDYSMKVLLSSNDSNYM